MTIRGSKRIVFLSETESFLWGVQGKKQKNEKKILVNFPRNLAFFDFFEIF